MNSAHDFTLHLRPLASAEPVAALIDTEGFPTAAAIVQCLQEVHDRAFGAPHSLFLRVLPKEEKSEGFVPASRN